MADNEQSKPASVASLYQEFIDQFRATTESMAGFGGGPPTASGAPSLPGGFPLPGSLSAAQMKSITDGIAAQRHSIEALKAQLSSFDEQLSVLEQLLGPLAEWSRTWAEFEGRLMNMGQAPKTQK